MARVTVTPESFNMVFFDAGRIAAVTEKAADDVGLPADAEVQVQVDETSPLGRSKLTSIDPVTLELESGALEDARRPRHLSEKGAADVIGRLLFRARDRMDPAFGDPPPEGDMALPQLVAWDVYAMGRLARLGYRSQRQRRLYHFRNRHGFTDAADAAFERLWSAEGLTWAEIVGISDEARSALPESA